MDIELPEVPKVDPEVDPENGITKDGIIDGGIDESAEEVNTAREKVLEAQYKGEIEAFKEAQAQRAQASKVLVKNIATTFCDVTTEEFNAIDLSKGYEEQTPAGKRAMEKIGSPESPIRKKLNELQDTLKKIGGKDFEKRIAEAKGDPEKLAKIQEEINAKIDKAAEDIDDPKKRTTWKDILKYILAGLIIAGIGAYIIDRSCKTAGKKSGCTWIGPNGKTYHVKIAGGPHVSSDCFDYGAMCGSCLHLDENTDKQKSCCNSAVDADADKHQKGTYRYVCSDAWSQVGDTLGSIISFPSNLLKGLEKDVIKIIIIIVLAFVAIGLGKVLFSWVFGGKKKSEETEKK